MTQKQGIFASLALAVFLALSAPASADTIKLRYGVIAASQRNIQNVAYTIAREKGFFAREGVDLDIRPLPGVEHMVNALDKGDVDVSFTATPYLINAVLKGSDSVGVIGGPQNTIYSLIAKPGLKTFADLKGKTIAVSLPVDTISIATRLMLAKHGLAETDFKAKELIGTPVRAKCLESGDCDAAPLSQPEDFLFLAKGFSKVGDSLEVISKLQFSVVAARRAWAREHGDAIVQFARATADGYRYMAAKANRDDVVATIARTTDASADVARAVLDFFYEPDRGVMPHGAEINMDGLQQVIDLLVQSGQLQAGPRAEQFVDLTWLKQAGLQ